MVDDLYDPLVLLVMEANDLMLLKHLLQTFEQVEHNLVQYDLVEHDYLILVDIYKVIVVQVVEVQVDKQLVLRVVQVEVFYL